MQTRRHKIFRFVASGLLLIGSLALSVFLWVGTQQRQYALDRQLVEALKKADSKQAFALIEDGADPNARLEPTLMPSAFQFLSQLAHRAPSNVNDSPTAFMMVCGADWADERQHDTWIIAGNPQMTQAMLHHGANINAKDAYGWTALHWAVMEKNKTIIKQLMDVGADPNQANKLGKTAIGLAESYDRPDLVTLLRKDSKRP